MNLFVASLLNYRTKKEAMEFLQKMINRLCQGQCRYGIPKAERNYMSRLLMEARAYKKLGNAEQLLNIANYALLEYNYPENKKFHFDANAKSITRGTGVGKD